jgi:very-short-patch-repair endonuclease
MANENARRLRKDMTDTERFVWWRLRNRQVGGFRFRRQHPVGRFVVDFVCLEAKLVLELDGSQHAERSEEDERRTARLDAEGYRVVRFWNHQVREEWDVIAVELLRLLNELVPQPAGGTIGPEATLSPSPLGREGRGGGSGRAITEGSPQPPAPLTPLPNPPPQGGREQDKKYRARRHVEPQSGERHYSAHAGGR